VYSQIQTGPDAMILEDPIAEESFLGGGPISWLSQQQINCALSSSES